jgi:hypothetical protein
MSDGGVRHKEHAMLIRLLAAALALMLAAPMPAQAWGALGHKLIGEAAAAEFPASLPAFVRSRPAAWRIGEASREPDRSRSAGEPHDGDLDPGHYVNVRDDGTIAGGPRLDALPPGREAYDTALRAVGATQYKSGFLPYSIIDGWQQLVKDFALWRGDVAGARLARSKADRQWFEQDRALRELLTLRDLGYWAHFVGDASQPMHVSVHYNGWGDGPNPDGFEATPGLHAKFESDFVDANIRLADVTAAMRPYRDCGCTIQKHTEAYLTATLSQLRHTYQFEKDGAYDKATPQSKTFAAARLAEAASMLRDLVTDAWTQSGQAVLGYKNRLPVADIEAGKVYPDLLMHEMRD